MDVAPPATQPKDRRYTPEIVRSTLVSARPSTRAGRLNAPESLRCDRGVAARGLGGGSRIQSRVAAGRGGARYPTLAVPWGQRFVRGKNLLDQRVGKTEAATGNRAHPRCRTASSRSGARLRSRRAARTGADPDEQRPGAARRGPGACQAIMRLLGDPHLLQRRLGRERGHHDAVGHPRGVVVVGASPPGSAVTRWSTWRTTRSCLSARPSTYAQASEALEA